MENNRILSKIRKLLAKAKDPSSSENEVEIFMKAAQKLMMEYNLQEGDIEIHPSDINKEVIFSRLWKAFRYKSTNYEWELLDTIAQFHNCRILHGIEYDFNAEGKSWKDTKAVRLSIVGTMENREIVKELYESCVQKFLILAETRYKEYQISKKTEILDDLKMMGLDTKGITVQYLQSMGRMISKPTFITSYLSGTIEGIKKYLQSQKSDILRLESDKQKWGLIVKRHDELIEQMLPTLFDTKIKTRKLGGGEIYSPEAYQEGIQDGSINPGTKMIN